MTITKADFGKKARDKITGFSGTITGMNSWITGCDQILLQPPINEKGEWQESRWFDDSRIEVIEQNKPLGDLYTEEQKRASAVGGPARSSISK